MATCKFGNAQQLKLLTQERAYPLTARTENRVIDRITHIHVQCLTHTHTHSHIHIPVHK